MTRNDSTNSVCASSKSIAQAIAAPPK